MAELRILLADDHEVVRKGLRALLDSHSGWKVVGEASDGREAVDKATDLKPDVVIMDITMPGLTGLEAAKKILADIPGTELLFFTMHSSEQMVHEALGTGAHGYVLKSDASTDLVAAIESLPRHKIFLSPRVAPLVSDGRSKSGSKSGIAKAPVQVLTAREREVLQLLAEGKSSKEVASALDITLKTVETHRANLMAKLDIHSLPALVRYAVRNKMVQP
ncbi:MAG: response regulator [Terriglobia bacterium]